LQKKNSTLWEHHATVGFPLVCTYGLYVSVWIVPYPLFLLKLLVLSIWLDRFWLF
jgi:hypothetical protein